MKFNQSLLALVAWAMLAGMVYAQEGAEKKSDTPKTEKKEKSARQMKLIKPWSLIEASLSAEQKDKILAIRQEISEERKKLEAREKEQIMAVLDDAQKEELAKAIETDKAAGKAPKGEKPDKGNAAEKPMEKKAAE